jgi:hypothetical protein
MNNIIRIPNISNYQQQIINNELVLTPISIFRLISLDELVNINLTNSNIIDCIITDNDNEIVPLLNNTYRRILISIYRTLPASFILQNTTFNIKLTNESGYRGYTWHPEINMSIQGKDSNGTFKEIIRMINLNNYKIDIKIDLFNNEKINYRNY